MDASKPIMFPPSLLAAVVLFVAFPRPACDAIASGLKLQNGWARPGEQGANDAGYLRIENRGASPDALIAAESPVAMSVSIHESRLVGQVMTMRLVKTLAISARSTVTLAPGGLHLMMQGLTRRLGAGQRFPMVLTFAKAGRERVEFAVGSGPPGVNVPARAM